MKTAIIISLILTLNLFADSYSEVTERAIIFQPGYVAGPEDWQPGGIQPGPNDPLWIVGLVQEFRDPFDHILPGDGSFEVTYSFDGFVWEEGGYFEDFQCTAGHFASFGSGRLEIFLDSTPDANFADPSTFRDGVVLLVAEAHNYLELYIIYAMCIWETLHSHQGYFKFTGGEWFDHVSEEGEGYEAHNFGEFTTDIPMSVRELGYIGQSESIINIYGKVPIDQSTWGQIKALYK